MPVFFVTLFEFEILFLRCPQSELKSFFRSGALSALHVAFSRDGASKDYVQHHIAREGAALWPLLAPPAHGYVYVCGDAKHMAKGRQIISL